MQQDRERLVEVTGAKEFEIIPKQFSFWYYNIAMEKPVYSKLVLK
jgi:hypothetical protein